MSQLDHSEAGAGDSRLELVVAAPVDAVWHALREPEQLRRWFGWEYDGLDEEIEQIFGAAAADEAALTVDTGGGRFELTDWGGHTIVRVVREDATAGEHWDAIDEGWLTFTQQLRYALERRPGLDRRTLYLTGEATDEDPRPSITALGLAEAGALDEGEPYGATLATGESISGEVWFSSEHQLGLTVTQWGDGLLVLFGRWYRPGGGPVVLVATTYGMTDDALAALEQRWTDWWAPQHGTPPPPS